MELNDLPDGLQSVTPNPQGEWTLDAYYERGDVVVYEGWEFMCVNPHVYVRPNLADHLGFYWAKICTFKEEAGKLSVDSSSPRKEWADALDEIAFHSHRIATEKGWHRDAMTVPHSLMMVVSEVAEILEVARRDNGDREANTVDLMAEECADVIIRLLDFAYSENLPVGKALCAKMKYNETRTYRHGDKPF